jgi:hypothetical protein
MILMPVMDKKMRQIEKNLLSKCNITLSSVYKDKNN